MTLTEATDSIHNSKRPVLWTSHQRHLGITALQIAQIQICQGVIHMDPFNLVVKYISTVLECKESKDFVQNSMN